MVTLCYGGPDTIAVRVQDEGVGFNPEMSTSGEGLVVGFGLIAIRERLATLGGSLDISSAPGHGTAATVRVPVRLG